MANHIDGLGGAERVSHLIANGLSTRGYDVALMGIRPAADERVDLSDLPYSTGFLSARPERPRGTAPWPDDVRGRMRAEAVTAMAGLLEGYRDGLFVCTQLFVAEHAAELGIEQLLDSGTRIIGQYHSSFEAAQLTGDFDRISRLYRQIDRFLLLSEEDAAAFRRKNFNNTGFVHNAVPFFPDDVSGQRDKVVVAVARQDENKQLDHALHAWSMIASKHPGWRLELYGDGPERAALLSLADQLGITDSVHFMGVVDDVESVLLRSSVALLCSRYEGLPMVLAEAIACGVPAVTYNSSAGIREIIRDGENGLVVSPSDIQGLADGLARLMSDDELRARYSRAARDHASGFAAEAVMDRWEEIIARTML
jgi:glycosyltransferase involved in cell wall biosynthesis